jgi:hypothetical protein
VIWLEGSSGAVSLQGKRPPLCAHRKSSVPNLEQPQFVIRVRRTADLPKCFPSTAQCVDQSIVNLAGYRKTLMGLERPDRATGLGSYHPVNSAAVETAPRQ